MGKKEGIWRLGLFKPDLFDRRAIAGEIYLRVKAALRRRPNIETEVRSPAMDKRVDQAARSWHHDCGGHAEYIALWCSRRPTEIRNCHTKRRVRLKPFEIIMISNDLYEHRRPPDIQRPRWFAVARIKP
jgi:hypothetical protein